MSRGTTWTEAQRKAALDIYRSEGAPTAAQRLGIPVGTIRRWASEAGERTPRPKPVEALEACQEKWEERRTRMLPKVGEAAELALNEVVKSIETGNPKDAKDLATTMAILVDKAQLLSGGATSRPNVDPLSLLSEAKGKVAQLVPMRKVG